MHLSPLVERARAAQSRRGQINRHLGVRDSEGQICSPARGNAVGVGVLTARGADRVRRVARTIADLAGADRVEEEHMAEAIGLRGEWRDE